MKKSARQKKKKKKKKKKITFWNMPAESRVALVMIVGIWFTVNIRYIPILNDI